MHEWVVHGSIVNDGSQPAEFADTRTCNLPAEIGIRSMAAPIRPGKARRAHAGSPDRAVGGLDELREVRDDVAREGIPFLEKHEN